MSEYDLGENAEKQRKGSLKMSVLLCTERGLGTTSAVMNTCQTCLYSCENIWLRPFKFANHDYERNFR